MAKALVVALGLAAVCAVARPLAQFASGVQLVEVYATVTDARGDPVTGLRRSDFTIFENDRPQTIAAFAAGTFPLTVALGVDRSWSMAGAPLREAKRASQAFLQALTPEDRSMVVAISDDAELIAPLSNDRASQVAAIAALDPWSTTALYDALIAMLGRLEPEHGRQAIVVFSDGTDRYSTADLPAVVERARRGQALIYPITIGTRRSAPLAELATLTGGRSFELKDARDLEQTLAAIVRELRQQYLIGYTPSDAAPSGAHDWRAIRVELTPGHPGLRVRARAGYTAG